MNFDELREIYRREMNSITLVKVEEDLYDQMAELCASLDKKYHAQYVIDPDSITTEGAEHRLKTARRLCKDIVRLRLKKLSDIAILDATEQGLQTAGVIELEFETLSAIVEVEKDHLMKCFPAVKEVQASNPAPKKEQSPAPEKPASPPEEPPKRGNLRAEVFAALSADRWVLTGEVLSKVNAPNTDVYRMLDRLYEEGKIQRYPPSVKGRKCRRNKIEWRLEE